MKHLEQYLERVNFWRVNGEKKPAYTIATLTRADAERIMESLECDLSPENLSCDGELSRTEQTKRFRLYSGAMKDINKMFPMVLPKYDGYDIFS